MSWENFTHLVEALLLAFFPKILQQVIDPTHTSNFEANTYLSTRTVWWLVFHWTTWRTIHQCWPGDNDPVCPRPVRLGSFLSMPLDFDKVCLESFGFGLHCCCGHDGWEGTNTASGLCGWWGAATATAPSISSALSSPWSARAHWVR